MLGWNLHPCIPTPSLTLPTSSFPSLPFIHRFPFTMSSRAKVLSLYRDLLHCSSRFASYNFRDYAIRRTKDAFRAAKNEADQARIEALIAKAEKELNVVKRQSVISQLYGGNKLVIESRGKKLFRKN
ncbi:hypothetical protein BGZ73_006835 [Actinomortierella ambigua]|nr:hypothetical protein BGZ73_006835 [Actinomortierella ambigua]